MIVGAQWGDEGKGKIVDLLAQESDVVCRYQGGPNAGHTVIVDGETFKFRHLPSGILSGKVSVLGAGCVVDPGGAARGARRPRGARHLLGAAPGLGQRAPDHAVAHRDRRGERAAARQAPDRDDAARDRARLRRQGRADRDPRPGPARPEDPAPEDRDRARREERLARARLRARAVRARGRRRAATRASRSGCGRTSPTPRCSSTRRSRDGQARPARGRAGDAARPRPRHLSVRHLVEPDRGRRGDGDRDRADADRRGGRRLEGVRHARRRAGRSRARWTTSSAAQVRELGQEFGTVTGRERRPAGSTSSRCATPCA